MFPVFIFIRDSDIPDFGTAKWTKKDTVSLIISFLIGWAGSFCLFANISSASFWALIIVSIVAGNFAGIGLWTIYWVFQALRS